jgi:hypothetical protein
MGQIRTTIRLWNKQQKTQELLKKDDRKTTETSLDDTATKQKLSVSLRECYANASYNSK